MMIRDNGGMESESGTFDCEDNPLLEDNDGDELTLLVKELALLESETVLQSVLYLAAIHFTNASLRF
jgi:hypothetical protein